MRYISHNSFAFKMIYVLIATFNATYPVSGQSTAIEICDNAIDDDMDGLIDLNDSDCDCPIIEPTSLIPNPSFEDLNCCPSDRSELGCAEVWIQASEPTTDLIHRCGLEGWDDFPPPFPFPDGEGIMGFRDGRVRGNTGVGETNWKEYAGACLLSPLLKDTLYRFQFDLGFVNQSRSPPINISFFGTSDCDNLPFGIGQEDFGCPTNGTGWTRLGSKMVSGGSGNRWVNTIIEVRPSQNIEAIAIGPDCPAVNTDVSLYYFFDNLLLDDISAFGLNITEESHPCQPHYSIKVPFNSLVDYQWYKDGIALVGETDSELNISYGEGDYQVLINNNTTCKSSIKFEHRIPVITILDDITICKDRVHTFGSQTLTTNGTYTEMFTSKDNCDSIVTITLKVLGTLADTVSASIFEGETLSYNDRSFKRDGDHDVVLQSSLGCDSLILLQIDYYDVYFPNVFSPNSDGINDRFYITSEEGSILNLELNIYDRWGAQIARGTDWDGLKENTPMNPGAYIYTAKMLMNDGIERHFSGSVTLVK